MLSCFFCLLSVSWHGPHGPYARTLSEWKGGGKKEMERSQIILGSLCHWYRLELFHAQQGEETVRTHWSLCRNLEFVPDVTAGSIEKMDTEDHYVN